jgi:hypothetical protein
MVSALLLSVGGRGGKSTWIGAFRAFLRQFGARCAILVFMRSRASRITVALVLLICVVGPVVEMFDRWDNTAQTGNDTEYSLVALALCVGAAYSLARFIFKCPLLRFVARSIFNSSANQLLRPTLFGFTPLLFSVISPPPLALRI